MTAWRTAPPMRRFLLLDALSRTRALTDNESEALETAMWKVGADRAIARAATIAADPARWASDHASQAKYREANPAASTVRVRAWRARQREGAE